MLPQIPNKNNGEEEHYTNEASVFNGPQNFISGPIKLRLYKQTKEVSTFTGL